MREIRCSPTATMSGEPVLNSWAGDTDPEGLVSFWAIRAVVEGAVNKQTGYVCDIKAMDDMLRRIVPQLSSGVPRRKGDGVTIASKFAAVFSCVAKVCPAAVSLRSLELRASPFTRLSIDDGDLSMVRLTRSFEFSAAHRLFCDGLSDEENLRIFGKCSNPHGHGHNYVLEVTVAGSPDDVTGTVADPPYLDQVVKERVIDPFDHKNLNLECAEFATLNPSVENIARVIWQRLIGAFDRCELTNVRVWETPKTYADYTGED